jgi:hypothetical protein
LITVAVLLLIGVLSLVFGLLSFVVRALRLLTGRRQRSSYEMNRRRAASAAFVAALCVYVLYTGGWPLNQLPPWVPGALIAVAGVSLLLLLAALHGARAAPRDLFSAVVSLAVAGGCAALISWQWHLPLVYDGPAADLVNEWLPGFYSAAASDANRMLPGVYVAVLVAALVQALICVQLLGGTRKLSDYQINRGRAVAAAFVLAVCLYALASGALGGLPPWVPLVLVAVAGLSLLFLLSGLYATRNADRNPAGVVESLAAVGVGAALLWWRWQLPPGNPAADLANRLLPGLYIAAMIAALVRALICVQLVSGARGILTTCRSRAKSVPTSSRMPATMPVPLSVTASRTPQTASAGFWAEMRESFERGRGGRPWRN